MNRWISLLSLAASLNLLACGGAPGEDPAAIVATDVQPPDAGTDGADAGEQPHCCYETGLDSTGKSNAGCFAGVKVYGLYGPANEIAIGLACAENAAPGLTCAGVIQYCR